MRRAARHAAILGAYAVLALVLTYPVALRPHAAIPIDHQIPGWAPGDGDPWQSLWAFWLTKESLLGAGRLPLFTDLIFHPLGANFWFVVLILHELLAGVALSALVGLVAAYNAMIVGSLALAGYAAFLLVRRVSGSAVAAFVGGLVFAFAPYQLAHALEHVFLLAGTLWVPLYVLFLLRLVEEGGRVNLGLAALWLALASLNPYYAAGLLVFTVVLVGARLREAWPRGGPAVRRCLTALLPVGVLHVIPYAGWLLRQPAGDTRLAPSLAAVNEFSADLLAFLLPSPLHPLWGALTAPIYARFTGNLYEQTVYPGYLVLALAGVALVWRRRAARFWIASAAVFAVLSLGALLHVGGRWSFDVDGFAITIPLPGLLLHFLPGVGGLRALSRFTVMTMLCLAVLVGLAVAALIDRLRASRRRPIVASGAAVIVGLAILVEYLSIPLPVLPTAMPVALEAMGAEVAPRPALLDVPLDTRIARYQYLQTGHRKPLIIGHLTRPSPALVWQLEGIPFLRFFQNPGGHCSMPSLQFVPRSPGTCPEPRAAWSREAALRVVDLFDLDTIVVHGEYLGAVTAAQVQAVVADHFPVDRVQADGSLRVFRLRRDHDRRAVWPPSAYQFDFGPASPRFFLAKGWWPSEQAGAVGMAWSMGRESTLGFFLPEASALTAELDLLPFVSPATVGQRIAIDVNGRTLGEIPLVAEAVWRPYALAIPAAAVRPGINTLRFAYARTGVPRDAIPGSTDRRELAVAFSRIVLRPGSP